MLFMSRIKRAEAYNRQLIQKFGKIDQRNRDLKEKLEDLKRIFEVFKDDGSGVRRIFKIDVGNFPQGKAEDYIRKLMQKYKNRTFNGNLTNGTEDYYFP